MSSSTNRRKRNDGATARRASSNQSRPPKSAPGSKGETNTTPPTNPNEQRVYARRPPTAKERVLAQWRGVDVRPNEIANQMAGRPTGEIVGKVLKKLRLDQRQAETEIVKVWNHLIDPNLTAHAQPSGVHKGTLFVNVDSSPWLDEIVRYRRKEILTRLQTAFGREMIQRISFRVG
ncbi:DUF721 domain-containing protein [bacterium]|nr:DUF721 domain-containing protein [bacterium]